MVRVGSRCSACLLSILLASAVHAAPSFVNGLAIPGAATDSLGTAANDGRLGFFSSLYYDPVRSEWWALSDRGPGGGTISYQTRVQRFALDVAPDTGAISNFRILETIRFLNGGVPLNGLAPSPSNVLGNAFDPEGFVVHPRTGNFLVSDEYGPSLYEFNRSGELVRVFETPANLIPRNSASGVPNFASDAGNNAGKRANRGFEGLAISPDGHYAFAMLQSAMLDEGGANGTVSRIVKFDTETGRAVAQYAYQMDTAARGRGTSALVALNDHEFLVVERNNRGLGVDATLAGAEKRVYRIGLAGATDVTAIDLDAPGAVYTPVTKSAVFIDLAANTLPALGNKVPEKWEGLTIGPLLSGGNFVIVAGTDNDYSVTQNSSGVQFDVYFRFSDPDPFAGSIQCPIDRTADCFFTAGGGPATLTSDYALLPGVLHAYFVPAADLLGYVRPISEPGSAALLLAAALGGVGFVRRQGLGRRRP